MTKVQMRFRLDGSLSEAAMARIADAHTIYGISRIQLARDLAAVTVEYDASRLEAPEVEAALRRAGISAVPEKAA